MEFLLQTLEKENKYFIYGFVDKKKNFNKYRIMEVIKIYIELEKS